MARCHGHRPSISRTRVQLRNVRMMTRPPSTARLISVGAAAIVLTMSAATTTSSPSSSERPMRILQDSYCGSPMRLHT